MYKVLTLIKEIIDYIAIAFMIWGLILALGKIVMNELNFKNRKAQMIGRDSIRVFLGTYILLGLEILILADIIGTIINPQIEELITLITIVVVRTVISFFLQRDVREAIQHVDIEEKTDLQ